MLYVARHGQTTWNVAGLVSGISDVPLTNTGINQAKLLAEEVSKLDQPITKIIHSPLIRAKETARIVAEANHLSLTEDARLMELNFGEMEGWDALDPIFRNARTKFATRFPKGESYLDMYARVVPLVEEVLADTKETYLLVAHNTLLRTMHCYFENLDNDEFFKFSFENAKLAAYDRPNTQQKSGLAVVQAVKQ